MATVCRIPSMISLGAITRFFDCTIDSRFVEGECLVLARHFVLVGVK